MLLMMGEKNREREEYWFCSRDSHSRYHYYKIEVKVNRAVIIHRDSVAKRCAGCWYFKKAVSLRGDVEIAVSDEDTRLFGVWFKI